MAKTVFITGTSSGLGKASAKYFAEQGWNVAATMRAPEKETELTQLANIRIFKLDVTRLDQVRDATEKAIAAFGVIDVVINNAGMGTFGALELAQEDDIDWQFAVNTRGPINIIRAFLPHFRNNGIGMFINVGSFMGLTTAAPLGSLYNMSKFALEGLTEGLYYELKPLNIDLRLIEPGGSTQNDFVSNIVWNSDPRITVPVYDEGRCSKRYCSQNRSAWNRPARSGANRCSVASTRSTNPRSILPRRTWTCCTRNPVVPRS